MEGMYHINCFSSSLCFGLVSPENWGRSYPILISFILNLRSSLGFRNATNLTDSVVISVMDSKREDFLGVTSLPISELISRSAKEGYVTQWCSLVERKGKKDRWAGGEVLVECNLVNDEVNSFCMEGFHCQR